MSYAETLFEQSLKLTFKDNIQYIKNYRPNWLKNPSTGKNLEYDFYIPKLKIAFEIQGNHHWVSDYQQYKDDIKRKISKKRNIYFLELSISQVKCGILRRKIIGSAYNKKRKITIKNILKPYDLQCKKHDENVSQYKKFIISTYKNTKAIIPPNQMNKKKIYISGSKLIKVGGIKYIVIEEISKTIRVRPLTSTNTKWIKMNKVDEVLF